MAVRVQSSANTMQTEGSVRKASAEEWPLMRTPCRYHLHSLALHALQHPATSGGICRLAPALEPVAHSWCSFTALTFFCLNRVSSTRVSSSLIFSLLSSPHLIPSLFNFRCVFRALWHWNSTCSLVLVLAFSPQPGASESQAGAALHDFQRYGH